MQILLICVFQILAYNKKISHFAHLLSAIQDFQRLIYKIVKDFNDYEIEIITHKSSYSIIRIFDTEIAVKILCTIGIDVAGSSYFKPIFRTNINDKSLFFDSA